MIEENCIFGPSGLALSIGVLRPLFEVAGHHSRDWDILLLSLSYALLSCRLFDKVCTEVLEPG